MRRARRVTPPVERLSPLAADTALAGAQCAAWVAEVLANGSRPAAPAVTLVAGCALIAPVAGGGERPSAR